MGLRYVAFRLGHELEKRTGRFKKRFPQNPPKASFITLDQWRKSFKFWGLQQGDKPSSLPSLLPDLDAYQKGIIPFFSAEKMELGKDYDWLTNPDTSHRYDVSKHWSEVQDIDPTAGDIKYVWEKSRFAYLYDVIRHDYYTKEDHGEWVFGEIRSWLNANPINSGPNYKCSQEISLRVLNWTYVLHYYKNSAHLTEDLFASIMHAIYWQLKHVYANINFSRIAVRNNHAITETLCLYLGALFYPFFPEASLWKEKGKNWFEEEILYQVYPDGTFLQFSMNYHRVVIQLFTWAFKSADFYEERFSDEVYKRAYRSIAFLHACQDNTTGWLPNYGNNDGALFFKYNSCDFRDYRPQLNALHVLLTGTNLYGEGDWQEDVYWFRAESLKGIRFSPVQQQEGWITFDAGGYYVLREGETLTFIRCGNHKDRPHQADNLHIDIWHKGRNLLFDAGSYKYNTDSDTLKYFMGTESHNSVMLNGYDQMEKGARFIWYYWTQALKAEVASDEEVYRFEGEISAFGNLDPKISHRRIIKKVKGKLSWTIEDHISNKPVDIPMIQYWHGLDTLEISSESNQGASLAVLNEMGYKSDYYGLKEEVAQWKVVNEGNKIITKISI